MLIKGIYKVSNNKITSIKLAIMRGEYNEASKIHGKKWSSIKKEI